MPPTRWAKSDRGMVVQQPAFLVSRMPALVPEFELAIVHIGGVSRTELTCDKPTPGVVTQIPPEGSTLASRAFFPAPVLRPGQTFHLPYLHPWPN